MSQTSIITEQYVTIHQTPANAGDRFIAAVIDIIIDAVYVFCGVMITDQMAHDDFRTFFSIVFVLIIPLLYPAIFEFFNQGRSPGKMLRKMRVVKVDGTPLTLGSILLRWLMLLVDSISGLWILVIVITRNNQRIGDLAAGTMVIKENSYSKVRVSLDEYDYLKRNYQPTYPEASKLTINQADTISHALNVLSSKRKDHFSVLARKVEKTLSVKSKNNDDEAFLTTVLHDYQYSLLEIV